MPVASLVRGFLVSLDLGSPHPSLCPRGDLLWNAFIRSIEERDLQPRFGPAYEQYAARVSCPKPGTVTVGD